MEIELHPEGDLEFIEASQRYESKVPGLGVSFIDEFEGLTFSVSTRKSAFASRRHFVERSFGNSRSR